MQQVWSELAVIGMLALCSAEDIKRQRICLQLVLAFGILGVLFHILWQQLSIGELLLGMTVGAGFVLLSFLTGGRIGVGDGVLVMVTGIFLGLEKNLALLLYGLLLCGLWALGCACFQRGRRAGLRAQTLPFVPFLLASYVLLLAGAR